MIATAKFIFSNKENTSLNFFRDCASDHFTSVWTTKNQTSKGENHETEESKKSNENSYKKEIVYGIIIPVLVSIPVAIAGSLLALWLSGWL